MLEQLAHGAALPAPISSSMRSTAEIYTTVAENAAAAALESFLLGRGGDGAIDLHVTPRHVPELKAFLSESSLRLVPFVHCYPNRFELIARPSHETMLIRLRSNAPENAVSSMLDMSSALEEKLIAKLIARHATRSSELVDPVPLTWLMRSAVGAVEAYVAVVAVPELLFHQQPEQHGFSSRLPAWWACVSAHLEEFVSSRSALLWHRGEACSLHASSCWCRSGISLTASETLNVKAKLSMCALRALPSQYTTDVAGSTAGSTRVRATAGGQDGCWPLEPRAEALPFAELRTQCAAGAAPSRSRPYPTASHATSSFPAVISDVISAVISVAVVDFD